MAVDYRSLDPDMRLCVTLLCSLRHTPSLRVREARAAALARWRAKRQRRRRAAGALQAGSASRSGVRKKLAENRTRVKGRSLKEKHRKAQRKGQKKPKSELPPTQNSEIESADPGKKVEDSVGLEEEASEKAKGDVTDEGAHRRVEQIDVEKSQESNLQDNKGEARKQLQVTGGCVEKDLVANSKVLAAA